MNLCMYQVLIVVNYKQFGVLFAVYFTFAKNWKKIVYCQLFHCIKSMTIPCKQHVEQSNRGDNKLFASLSKLYAVFPAKNWK